MSPTISLHLKAAGKPMLGSTVGPVPSLDTRLLPKADEGVDTEHVASSSSCRRVAPEDLVPFQGRWQHNFNDMGLMSVYGDVALFDRGSALRIGRSAEHGGAICAGGWILVADLSHGHDALVWARPDADQSLICEQARVSGQQAWYAQAGVCAWVRVDEAVPSLFDRFAKLPIEGILGLPERVSTFYIPPPVNMPSGTIPWRLLVYGGCLTIGWPSGDSYARSLIDKLGERGVYGEAVGCGISAHLSHELAEGVWRRDFVDKMGLRGEGILRMNKRRGPFDLAVIMIGIADIVRGKSGNSVCDLHTACHREGLQTVAISVPPSWHDGPSGFEEKDLRFCKQLDAAHKFESPEVVAAAKACLNAGLRQLATPFEDNTGQQNGRTTCALYVETSDFVLCSSKARSLWFDADWIHLTAEGNQCLGRGIGEHMAPLLQAFAKAGVVPRAAAARRAAKEPAASLGVSGQDNATKKNDGGSGDGKSDAATSSAAASSGVRWIWRVAGGRDHGGILVRHGPNLDSEAYAVRLRIGSLVEAVELRGNRFRYIKHDGYGPDNGWVSLLWKGKELLLEPEQALTEPPQRLARAPGSLPSERPRHAVWRCAAKPGILIRSAAYSEAPVVGVVRHDEEIIGDRVATNGGWLKLGYKDRYVLLYQDWKGYLLEPVTAQHSE